MENYNNLLKKQLQEIDSMIAQTEKSLKNCNDLVDRRVFTSKSNGTDQYLWVDQNTRKRRYAKASEKDILRRVIQRDYDVSVKRKLLHLRNTLERFLRQYDIDEIEKVYDKMSATKKKLAVPIIEPDDVFIEKWKNIQYDPMPIENDTSFYSGGGIRVRSKSELMIADILEQKGIPYHYEYPLFLRKTGIVRPDFLCLNTVTRKEFIWEHFGMMDNIAYANKNIFKIQNYEQEGFISGKNLIFTFETSQCPLSSVVIRKTIEEYLL